MADDPIQALKYLLKKMEELVVKANSLAQKVIRKASLNQTAQIETTIISSPPKLAWTFNMPTPVTPILLLQHGLFKGYVQAEANRMRAALELKKPDTCTALILHPSRRHQ